MKLVDLYGRVRYAVRIEGVSSREAARRFGIDPRTVAKMLSFSVPPRLPPHPAAGASQAGCHCRDHRPRDVHATMIRTRINLLRRHRVRAARRRVRCRRLRRCHQPSLKFASRLLHLSYSTQLIIT